MWSWLSPSISHLVGATTPFKYLLLHAAFTIAFFAITAYVLFKHLPDRESRLALLILAALPITPTLLLWVGDDAFTALLLAGCVFPLHSRVIRLGSALLLGMQHFEVGILALMSLTLAHVTGWITKEQRPQKWGFLAALLAAVGLGHMLLRAIFSGFQIQVSGGRASWIETYLPELVDQFFSSWQFIAYSLLGAAWIIWALSWRSRGVGSPFSVGTALLCSLVISVVVFDQTRIASLVLLPTLFTYWLFNRDFLLAISRSAIPMLTIVWLVTPVIWVWQGQVQPGASSTLVEMVIQSDWPSTNELANPEVSLRPFLIVDAGD